jgi:hypothetical protein
MALACMVVPRYQRLPFQGKRMTKRELGAWELDRNGTLAGEVLIEPAEDLGKLGGIQA